MVDAARMTAELQRQGGSGPVVALGRACEPERVSAARGRAGGLPAGVRHSFTGAITKPRDISRGGYIGWHHPPGLEKADPTLKAAVEAAAETIEGRASAPADQRAQEHRT
jgi:hypothetical protein